MRKRFGKFLSKKSGYWYWQDNDSRKSGKLLQGTLGTKDEVEAERLLHARNEAHYQPSAINIQMARAYLSGSDPKLSSRTWQEVMEQLVALKKSETHRRWSVAIKDKNFDTIRKVSVLETRADHFLKVLSDGKTSSNVYLRRIHNFALAMDWLLRAVLPKPNWPKVIYKPKRGITAEEHLLIIGRELNSERKAFYQLCWHLGGSQTDIACLDAEDVNWNDRTICYDRKKLENRQDTGIKPPLIRFGKEVADILGPLPTKGALFPYLRTVRAGDRATEFKQRCDGLKIKGISLHSYRYAWAERARRAGYPLRFAEEALGHNSKAVHRAYARKAEVCVPCLDDWEKTMQEKMVNVDFDTQHAQPSEVQGLVATTK